MAEPVALPESLRDYLARRPGSRLEKIHAEASRRSFYRIRRGRSSRVAMVYPQPSRAEVERFAALQWAYRAHGLRVPGIEEVLADQVVIQEDAGDLLLQRAWHRAGAGERRLLLRACREILENLAAVPSGLVSTRLDLARREWELDFFLEHFLTRFPAGVGAGSLGSALRRLAALIGPEEAFAHRDFHSRNLLVCRRELVMVDFQDSLVAPRYYDLVSLAFDSYLDLGSLRGMLCPNLAALGDDTGLRQMRLTALQRNVKALGTFAFQAFARGHRVYLRYIPRTIGHIREHLLVLNDSRFDAIAKYFSHWK